MFVSQELVDRVRGTDLARSVFQPRDTTPVADTLPVYYYQLFHTIQESAG